MRTTRGEVIMNGSSKKASPGLSTTKCSKPPKKPPGRTPERLKPQRGRQLESVNEPFCSRAHRADGWAGLDLGSEFLGASAAIGASRSASPNDPARDRSRPPGAAEACCLWFQQGTHARRGQAARQGLSAYRRQAGPDGDWELWQEHYVSRAADQQSASGKVGRSAR